MKDQEPFVLTFTYYPAVLADGVAWTTASAVADHWSGRGFRSAEPSSVTRRVMK